MPSKSSAETQARQAIAAAQARWEEMRGTIVVLKRYLQVSEATLAQRMGLSRTAVSARLTGATDIRPWEADGFAVALGVPRDVLDLSARDALRWVLDNRVESRCFRPAHAGVPALRWRAPAVA